MKKVISALITASILFTMVLPCFAADAYADGFGAYDSVVILGIDGAGAFFDNAYTPNCDEIFSENSFVCDTVKADPSTNSAENWAAILCGVPYSMHGIDNGIAGSVERGSDTKYPTIFKLARDKSRSAKLVSVCNWNPINFGIIENNIGVVKDGGSDDEVCAKVVDMLKTSSPKILFAQFDDVDHFGHESGYGSKAFMDSMTKADGYIGEVYEAIEQSGKADSTLFIVVSDHGGTNNFFQSGGHGNLTYNERTVFLAVKGKTVKAASTHNVHNRDVAAIALYALGIEPTQDMTSKIPTGLFDGKQAQLSVVEEIQVVFGKIAKAIVNFFVDLPFMFGE